MKKITKIKQRYKFSQVTPKNIFLNRRNALLGAVSSSLLAFSGNKALSKIKADKSEYSTKLKPNSYDDITSYNNFYEFGTAKTDPFKYANKLTTKPWTVNVEGLIKRPGSYYLNDIIETKELEERIYPLRCVEGWSMIIPWIGFPLRNFLESLELENDAKYVYFETLLRPEEMIGQRYNVLDWPYREGLTIEEAMHPLTILAIGLYGDFLPNQNGAPLRLVVPWKYGFKSIKSIVKIRIMKTQPETSWSKQNPREYGFYSNVNPEVDHPRWSQATERVIGQGIFAKRKKTLLFNGYADEVSHLYKGMDLKKYY